MVTQRSSSSAGVWALRRLGVAPPVPPRVSPVPWCCFQSTEPTIPSAGREELLVQCYICALPSTVNRGQRDGAVTIFDRWTLLLTSVNIHNPHFDLNSTIDMGIELKSAFMVKLDF